IGPLNSSFSAFLKENGPAPASSNDWVVGPKKSADGAPIVANDPHLVQQVPSLWYVVDVEGGGLHVAGATVPGSPFILTGPNQKTAGGMTNPRADYIDLAVLTRRGEDGYVLAGQEKKLRRVPLTVKVKGGADVHGEALWTDVGLVITELKGDAIV